MVEICGWSIVVPMLAIVAARMLAWDSRSLLVGANGMTPFLYLPAWPVAVVAGLLRRWALLAAAGAVIVAHVSFALPELLAARDVPVEARVAPGLRVFDANVLAGNVRAGGYAEEIRRARPDVVILQEPSPAFVAAIESSGALGELPHRLAVTRTDPFAMLLASRWPVTEDDVVSVRGRPVLLRATATVGARTIRLFAFHAIAPVGGTLQEWKDDLAVLGKAVRAEQRPVVIVGDFNATWGNRAFRRLLDGGLTDGAAARGKPFQMTWPRNRRILPPVLRVDHVLTTKTVVVTRIELGTGRGSDHRPIVADVAVLGP